MGWEPEELEQSLAVACTLLPARQHRRRDCFRLAPFTPLLGPGSSAGRRRQGFGCRHTGTALAVAAAQLGARLRNGV